MSTLMQQLSTNYETVRDKVHLAHIRYRPGFPGHLDDPRGNVESSRDSN